MTHEFTPFQKLTRLKNEHMCITEKIDGTNAQIYIYEENDLLPGFEYIKEPVKTRKMLVGSRNRYITSGKETDNYGFAAWCEEHKEELLKLPLGRHYGEWWGRGIGRNYGKEDRTFSLFDQRLRGIKEVIPCIDFVPVLYEGAMDFDKIQEVMESLKTDGSTAMPGFMDPEGVVVWLRGVKTMYKKTFDDRHKGEIV